MLVWESIVADENYQYTMRLKVHKGWIVKSGDSVKDTVSMCFISDENFEWNPLEE